MNRVASPSPKRTLNDVARGAKDNSAAKPKEKTPREKKVSGSGVKAVVSDKKIPTVVRKTTRRRKRGEGAWNYMDRDQAYVLEPQRPDVHKYTFIYLHYLCGHPKEYFKVE